MFEITDFTSTTRWEKECEKYKSIYKVSDEDLKEKPLILRTLLNISQEKPNYEIGNFTKLNNPQNFEITKQEISLNFFPFSNAQEFIDYFIFKINLISLNSPKFKNFKCIKSTKYSVSLDYFDLKLRTRSYSNHENNFELKDSTILSGNSMGIYTMQAVFPTYFHKWAKSRDISRIIEVWERDDVPGLGFVDKKDLRLSLQGILTSNPKKSKSSSKPPKIKEPPCFPKDSVLWAFSERILDAASMKPKFLSHETPFIPFLRGFWLEFKYLIKNVCIPEGLYLPGIESVNDSDDSWKVDYKNCLLHQKLSLLNICIHQSIQRDEKTPTYTSVLEHPFVRDSVESELQSPIELTLNISKKIFKVFTENDEKQGLDDILGGLTTESWNLVKSEVLFEASPDQEDIKRSSWGLPGSPDGRSCKSDWISLGTGEPIYIPVTQDPVQLTEDDLLSLQTRLVELGTSKEGARLRAKLQCENLRSDMQAFKAANPGCILADFVRWHSPKDWIENGDSGSLSSRMTEPGNLWEELWNAAEPIAASLQKPLFNVEQTIVEILEYLDSITVHDLLDWIVPTLLYMHFTKLTSDEVFSCFSHVQNLADCFVAEWSRIDWKSISPDNPKVSNVLNLLKDMDEFCNHAWALIKIFPNDLEFIQTVILSQDFSTSDFPDSVKADLESLLTAYIKSEDLLPVSQEFEFTTNVPLPSPSSRTSTQKICFTVTEEEFIIKEVFSHDTLWL